MEPRLPGLSTERYRPGLPLGSFGRTARHRPPWVQLGLYDQRYFRHEFEFRDDMDQLQWRERSRMGFSVAVPLGINERENPAPGYRNNISGVSGGVGYSGFSYSSSVSGNLCLDLYFHSQHLNISISDNRAHGFQLRCLSEQTGEVPCLFNGNFVWELPPAVRRTARAGRLPLGRPANSLRSLRSARASAPNQFQPNAPPPILSCSACRPAS